MKKLLFKIEQFVEEQGITLSAIIATGMIVVLITVISWFWPGIYSLIKDNHIFEAIVLTLLIEIVVLLANRKNTENEIEVFADDTDAQTKILELTKQIPISKAVILSSGLASRRLIISPFAKSGVKVEIFAQDPETAVDERDIQRLQSAIDWIKFDIGDKFLTNLDMLFVVRALYWTVFNQVR